MKQNNQYSDKSFLLSIKREGYPDSPLYYFKLEDKNVKESASNLIKPRWKSSIISSFFNDGSYKEDNNLEINNVDTFGILIVIHSAKDLHIGQSYDAKNAPSFAQDYLFHKICKASGVNDKKETIQPRTPIIHITLTNIYVDNMYGDNVELFPLIPRSYQIMDSSIWNYLVPFNGIPESKNNTGESGSDRFKSAISSIINNYERGLYYLSVSHEYADLNGRLALQSYLSGAHASGVAPFIFHSESATQRMICDEFFEHEIIDEISEEVHIEGRNTINSINNWKWRILLVDDKAVSPMEATGTSARTNYEFSWNCKLTIIRDVLEKRFGIKGKIHCRHCSDNRNDDTLSFTIKEGYSISKSADFFIKQINDLKDRVIENDIRNLNGEERRKRIKELKDALLFSVLPIGEPIEGFKFYFNSNAVKYGLKDSVNIFLRSLLPNNVEIKEGCPSSSQIVIEYAQCIEDAEKALRQKKYDIILMDYLLNGEKRKEYGYRLLGDIYGALKYYKDDYTSNKDGYKIGPSERYFFIFISAYSTAVYERLLAEGLNRSEKYWHIAVGACPTNTPQLFLYNLIKLMEKRLDDSGIDRLTAKGIFNVVKKIYGKMEGEDSGKPVRYRANKYYQKVLDMHYLYKKMLNDVHIPSGNNESIFNTTESVLISTFIIQNVNLGGFLEHLTQLVHLTAFGTIRQWPEMWEEYIYFKAQFNIAQFIENGNSKDEFNQLCVEIEDHILGLKTD